MFAESAVGVHKDLAAFSAFDGKMAHDLSLNKTIITPRRHEGTKKCMDSGT
jgi:hypothetical protein